MQTDPCLVMLNLSLETCGGMASDAVRLVKAIGKNRERWSAGTWNSGQVERLLLGSIAVAAARECAGDADRLLPHDEHARCGGGGHGSWGESG